MVAQGVPQHVSVSIGRREDDYTKEQRDFDSELLTKIAALGVKLPPWTAKALLPGGDLTGGSFARFLRNVERRYPWLPEHLRKRYSRAYGTRIDRVIGNARSVADLGREVVPHLHEAARVALDERLLQLEAEDDVQVVRRLVGLDADQRRLDRIHLAEPAFGRLIGERVREELLRAGEDTPG